MNSKKILITFAGQVREFEHAVFSHAKFIADLHDALDQGIKYPRVEIYVSFVTWAESYSAFPKNVRSFVQTGVTENTIRSIIGNKFDGIAEQVNVDVISESETATVTNESTHYPSTDEFYLVSYLNYRCLRAMMQIEKEGGFTFDSIIMTRPDLYLTLLNINAPYTALIDQIAPTVVYYPNAVHSASANSYLGNSSVIVKYEEFCDQFNIFGRVAFYAYGIAYHYIRSLKKTDVYLHNLSLHYWLNTYLEKFRIVKSELHDIQVLSNIIRPIWKNVCPDIQFDTNDIATIHEQLSRINNQWQTDMHTLTTNIYVK